MKQTTVEIKVMVTIIHPDDVDVKKDVLPHMDYGFELGPDSGSKLIDSEIISETPRTSTYI